MAAFPNQLPLIPPNDIWSYRNLKSLKAMITKLGLSFSRDTSSLAHRCGIYRGTKLDTWRVEQWRTAIDSLLATYNKLNPRDEALLKAYSKFYMVSPIWKPSKKEAKRIEVWEMERFLLFGRTKDGVITNDLQALRHRYAALLDSVGHKLHFALHFRRDLKQVLDTLGKVGSDPNYDWVYCHLGQLGELETAQAALAQGSHSNTAVANLVFGLACGGHLQLLEASQLDEDQYLEWILEGATAGGRIEILKRYLPPDARFARLLIQKSVKYNRSQTSLFLISHFKPLLPPTERLHLIHSAGL